jgi:hypothetical protein
MAQSIGKLQATAQAQASTKAATKAQATAKPHDLLCSFLVLLICLKLAFVVVSSSGKRRDYAAPISQSPVTLAWAKPLVAHYRRPPRLSSSPLSRICILLLLLCAGVESNPGPVSDGTSSESEVEVQDESEIEEENAVEEGDSGHDEEDDSLLKEGQQFNTFVEGKAAIYRYARYRNIHLFVRQSESVMTRNKKV